MDFELEESHMELNEVVVTGVSAATEQAINPIQTITINKISLNQSSSTNIIDAISNKPGMSQITTGAGISKPVIRGLGFNRVAVLQNNMRQEGQQWGDEHGIEIDEFAIDRVEIIKGPGSLIYGSDAIAEVPSYSLLHTGIGSDVVNQKGSTLFSIYFSATNILDVAYQSHLSRLKYAPENLSTNKVGVFNMGRNFNIK